MVPEAKERKEEIERVDLARSERKKAGDRKSIVPKVKEKSRK